MDADLGKIISFSEQSKDIGSIISQEISRDRRAGWAFYNDTSISRVLEMSANVEFEVKN